MADAPNTRKVGDTPERTGSIEDADSFLLLDVSESEVARYPRSAVVDDMAADVAGPIQDQIDGLENYVASGPMSRTVYLDANLSLGQSPVFADPGAALTELRAIVSDGKGATLVVGYESNGDAYNAGSGDAVPFFTEYVSGYSEQSGDSRITVRSNATQTSTSFIDDLIRGLDVDLNDAPYDIDLNDFRVDIDL